MLRAGRCLAIALVVVVAVTALSQAQSLAEKAPASLPATGFVGTAISFVVPPDLSASAGTAVWSFGDGIAATGSPVQHTYQSPGVYRVQVVVTLPTGALRLPNGTLHIYPAGTPILHCAPGPGVPPVDARCGGAFPNDYPAGWNLVSGASGIVLDPDSDLYALRPDGTGYEPLPFWTVLRPGVGYWVYFAQPGKVWWPGPPPPPMPISLPLEVPASGRLLIGNPFFESAIVYGQIWSRLTTRCRISTSP